MMNAIQATRQPFFIEHGILKQYNGDDAVVTVPADIREIGYGAFRGCNLLQQVILPAGITKIGSLAFAGCTQLTAVTIPDGVREIGYSAFEYCTKLTDIRLPEGLTLLDRMAFLGCTALADIQFPDTLRTVGWDALRDTAWLTQQPEGVVYAGKLALFWQGTLIQAEIQPGTVQICVDAFRNCNTLTSITLPDSLQEIQDRAFQNCRKLKQITIPHGVEKIGYRAFHECTKLQVLLESDTVTLGKQCFPEDTKLRITHLNPAALPDAVRPSAIIAFADDVCNRVLLEGAFTRRFYKYIQSRRKLLYPLALEHWNLLQLMLQTRMIPLEDVEELLDTILASEQAEAVAALIQYKQTLNAAEEDDLFGGWDDLELDWDLPTSEKSLADLQREWGSKTNSDGTLRLLLYHGKDVELTVPSRIGNQMVTAIAPAACSPTRYGIKRETAEQRRRIITVTIQEGITKIGNHAFADCTSLTNVTLPESIIEIGYEAFRNCSKLMEIVLPQSVEVIGSGAFAGCGSLITIRIPCGAQIAADAFTGCPGVPLMIEA